MVAIPSSFDPFRAATMGALGVEPPSGPSFGEQVGQAGAIAGAGLLGKLPAILGGRKITKKQKKLGKIQARERERQKQASLAEIAASEQLLKERFRGEEFPETAPVPLGGLFGEAAAEDIERLGTRSATPFQMSQERLKREEARRLAALRRARAGVIGGAAAQETFARVQKALDRTARHIQNLQAFTEGGLSGLGLALGGAL